MGWAYLEGWKQTGFAEYKRNILILAVTGTVMAVCLVLLNFVYKQAVRQGLMAVLALALLVNVASEGAANFQARVTMKKTDTPAELMEQKMAQYEADRKSDDKETKYRAEMNKPQDFFQRNVSGRPGAVPGLSGTERPELLPGGKGLHIRNSCHGCFRPGL